MRLRKFFCLITSLFVFISAYAMPDSSSLIANKVPNQCPPISALFERPCTQDAYCWTISSAYQAKGWVTFSRPYKKDSISSFHVVYINDVTIKPRYGASMTCYYTTSDSQNVAVSYPGDDFSASRLSRIVSLHSLFRFTDNHNQVACGFGPSISACHWRL